MAAAAGIPDDEWLLRWGEELVVAVGTIAAGVAIGSGLVEGWKRREWKLRTQWLVFEHVTWAQRNLAWLAADIFDLTYGLMRFPYGVAWPQDLVALPVTGKQEEVLKLEVTELKKRLASPIVGDDFDSLEPDTAAARVRAAAPDLKDRVDEIWSAVVELSDYVEPDVAEELLKNALWLRSKVTDAWDPMPGVKVPAEALSFFGAIEWPEALRRCGELASALSVPYRHLDSKSKAPDLRKKLNILKEERQKADARLDEDLVDYERQMEARALISNFDRDMTQMQKELDDLKRSLERDAAPGESESDDPGVLEVHDNDARRGDPDPPEPKMG
jgi:hypothetical protein